MKWYIEKPLSRFAFWDGGLDRAKQLTEAELDRLDDMLPEVFGEEIPEAGEVNDLFWFNFSEVCRLLGYGCNDADEPVRPGDEPDEDEEDEGEGDQ